MILTSFTALLLFVCSAVDFPQGHCDGANNGMAWQHNLLWSPHDNTHAVHWTAKKCKNDGGKCCSADMHPQFNYPPFDATASVYQNIVCKYCWKTDFVAEPQSAPAPGPTWCTDKKPQDMKNTLVLYSLVNGKLKEKYCPTQQVMTASVPTLELKNHHSKCPKSVFPCLPGSGYNILTGMPLPLGENVVDPGYLNNPVFDPTYDDCHTTGNHDQSGYWEWTIPDQYESKVQNTISAGRQMSVMHDEESFQQQALTSLSSSGGGKALGVGMEFTASAEWKSSTSIFSDGDKVEQRYHRTAYAYQTTLTPFNLKLTDAYLAAITTAFVNENWSIFFADYGTHVTTEILSGARYTQVTTFTRSKYEEITSNSAAYNAGIKASYEGATGAVSAGHESSKDAQDLIQSYKDSQYFVSTGGDGAVLNATDTVTTVEYQKSAHNFPAPLSAKILQHDVLILQSKWADFKNALKANFPDQASDVTKEQFQKKWLAGIDEYCGDEAHKCQQATSLKAPKSMTLTDMFWDSEKYGEDAGNKWDGKGVVEFSNMPHFQENYKSLIQISRIHTFCSKHNERGRLRGLQFEYFDGDRTILSDVLGYKNDSDSDIGLPWDDESNKIAYDEIITAVTVSSGSDVDGLWFTVQKPKSKYSRKIGCGYSTPHEKSWNIKPDNKLLAFSGTWVDMEKATMIRQIQFRSFLYLLPTMTAEGPECECYTPNAGTKGFNGAKCTDGKFLWCGDTEVCTNGNKFPQDKFREQCSALTKTLKEAPSSVSAHHEKLLQQIVNKKKGLQNDGAAPVSGKSSNFAAPQKAKKDSDHHKKWEEAEDQVKDAVKEMSEKLKQELKAELKDFAVKELKTALGHLTEKQSHLESTVTRMLINEVESYNI